MAEGAEAAARGSVGMVFLVFLPLSPGKEHLLVVGKVVSFVEYLFVEVFVIDFGVVKLLGMLVKKVI